MRAPYESVSIYIEAKGREKPKSFYSIRTIEDHDHLFEVIYAQGWKAREFSDHDIRVRNIGNNAAYWVEVPDNVYDEMADDKWDWISDCLAMEID